MPSSKPPPFSTVTIEGVAQRVKGGLVYVQGLPDGRVPVRNPVRWRVDESKEKFESRITNALGPPATGTSVRPPPRREAASLEGRYTATVGGCSTPVSQRAGTSAGKRPGEKRSPNSADMPPPADPHARSKQSRQGAASSTSGPPFVASSSMRAVQGSTATDGSSMELGEAHAADVPKQLKRLHKKVRQIEVLQAQARSGRCLSTDEQAKVESLGSIQIEMAILEQSLSTSMHTPTLAPTLGGSGSAQSAAHTVPAAAVLASGVNAARASLEALEPPPPRVCTRANAIEVQKLMAKERAEYERAQQALQQRAVAAELGLWGLLRTPLESWEDKAVWQIAMCASLPSGRWRIRHRAASSCSSNSELSAWRPATRAGSLGSGARCRSTRCGSRSRSRSH